MPFGLYYKESAIELKIIALSLYSGAGNAKRARGLTSYGQLHYLE
jgi:hypothetical protein